METINYETMTIGELRKIHSELGGAPCNKKKSELIDEIVRMQKGELKPERSSRGRKPLSIKRDILVGDEISDVFGKRTVELHSSVKVAETVTVYGVFEITEEGFGYLRARNYVCSNKDAIVPPAVIEKFKLKTGDFLGATAKRQPDQIIAEVNDIFQFNNSGQGRQKLINFDDLTSYYPVERLPFSSNGEKFTRAIDLVSPIGKGQRAFLSFPFTYDRLSFFKGLAESLSNGSAQAHIVILSVAARPEEITEYRTAFSHEFVSTGFNETPRTQVHVVELCFERLKRIVEDGVNVILFCDSLTNLFNVYVAYYIMALDVDPETAVKNAIESVKKLFGVARKTYNSSFTIVAAMFNEFTSIYEKEAYEAFFEMSNCRIKFTNDAENCVKGIDFASSSTDRCQHMLVNEEVLLNEKIVEMLKSNPRGNEIFTHMIDSTRNNKELLLKFDKLVKKYGGEE